MNALDSVLQVEGRIDIVKRIGAFLLGVFLPVGMVVGSLTNTAPPQPRYTAWTFDLTLLACAAIWAWRLAHGKQGWSAIARGAWLAASTAIIVVMLFRNDASGLLSWTVSIVSIIFAGLFALSFRLLAFAFRGPPN
jgi:hypothetical protein